MTKKQTYLVFVVQAFRKRMEDGRLQDSVGLELIAKTGDEAVKRAKKIIIRKHYRIGGVIEKYHE
jgi:hypothetical protein